MAHNKTGGRARSSKKVGAVLGMAAVGLMAVLPLALNGWQATTQSTPGPGPYAAFTLPPTMTEGVTETTTIPSITVAGSVPATAKAVPMVRAPHK